MNKFTITIVLLVVGMAALIYFAASNSDSSAMLDATQQEILQVKDGDWVKGNPDSDVVLVEYADFECPACGAYYPLVEEIADAYGDQIAVVYRDFPLSFHQNARTAAWAAEAAGEQGMYFEMMDLLFTNQQEWSGKTANVALFYDYAESLGLDMDQFRDDAVSDEIKDRVEEDYQSGLAIGVNSTPTFFLNGQRITGMQSTDDFAELINQALAEAAAGSASSTASNSDEAQDAVVFTAEERAEILGTWQSQDDALSRVVFSATTKDDVYEEETVSSETYMFVDSCDATGPTTEPTNLFKTDTGMCYSIVELSGDALAYYYVDGTGTILTYSRVN